VTLPVHLAKLRQFAGAFFVVACYAAFSIVGSTPTVVPASSGTATSTF
jgi:hypothetical protein